MKILNVMNKALSLGLFAAMLGCVEAPTEKVNTITSAENPHVIAPQNCPDWSKADGNGGSDFGNTPSSNYGCATITNYGAMIDDPNDMVTGKTTNLTNGARSAVPVASYESGPSAGASSSGASSSGGGGT